MSKPKRSRRNFTSEQKAEALRRHLVERVPISQICNEMSLQPSVFHHTGRVLLNSPGCQDRQHAVTACNSAPDDFAIVRGTGNDTDAVLVSVELLHALGPAHADDLVSTVQRVLHHVLTELSGRSYDAHFH